MMAASSATLLGHVRASLKELSVATGNARESAFMVGPRALVKLLE